MINNVLEAKLVQKLNLQEVEAADFYRTIFPKGSLEEAGNQQPGKYNAMVYAVLPDMDTAHILHMHDDLALLNEMRVSDASMNCVSYAGKEPKEDYARYLHAFFVRVNLSTHPEAADAQVFALKRYLETGIICKRNLMKKGDKFEWGYSKNQTMHFIRPTYLMVDHGHLYLCFVMYRPLSMYLSNRQKLQDMMNDISEKINYGLSLPAIYPVDILEHRTVVGKGDCRAYRFPEKRHRHVSLDELNACVPKKKLVYIKGESKFDDQPNLFPWFLREARKLENQQTIKPRVFVVAAAYAAKGSIPLDTVMKELEKLGEELLPLFGEQEIRKQINDARYFYMYDFYWLRRRLRATLSEECGFDIPKAKRNKGADHHTRRAHCDKINREINDKLKREADVLNWFDKNPEGTQKQCAEALGISISTVNKWLRREKERLSLKAAKQEKAAVKSTVPQEKKSSRTERNGSRSRQQKIAINTLVDDTAMSPWSTDASGYVKKDFDNYEEVTFVGIRRVKIPHYLSSPYNPSKIHVYGSTEEKQEVAAIDVDNDDDLPF